MGDEFPDRAAMALLGVHPTLEAGIAYTCTCPQFNHYFNCKHCIAMGLHLKKVKVPDRFSMQVVGKRKAPAGASLSKRSRCLEVDA